MRSANVCRILDNLQTMRIEETDSGYTSNYDVKSLVDHINQCLPGEFTYINLDVIFIQGGHSCSLVARNDKIEFFNPNGNIDTKETDKILRFLQSFIPITIELNSFNIAGAIGPQYLVTYLLGDLIDNGICGLYVTIYLKNLGQGRSNNDIHKQFTSDINANPVLFYKNTMLFAIKTLRTIKSGESNVYDLTFKRGNDMNSLKNALCLVQLVTDDTARETAIQIMECNANSIFSPLEMAKLIMSKKYPEVILKAKIASNDLRMDMNNYISSLI